MARVKLNEEPALRLYLVRRTDSAYSRLVGNQDNVPKTIDGLGAESWIPGDKGCLSSSALSLRMPTTRWMRKAQCSVWFDLSQVTP